MTMTLTRWLRAVAAAAAMLLSFSSGAQNPFLPLWEYIPDGEPYVFDDPDNPGKQRVYLYGSHDKLVTAYCGLDQVVWSASVDNLLDWRCDGVIFQSKTGADGRLLNPDGKGDILYAPDVALVTDPKTGKKTYYLYPNNQADGRKSMVAKSDRPDGPFTVCNWDPSDPSRTVGVLDFDPAVLVDKGRVYGYWGINTSYCAELAPATMATVKPGTEVTENMVSSRRQDGIFRFFEASSIRKIKDKYVFIYSRWTADGEFGLGNSNYTLAYAYSDNPLGPWTYGGTIIDGRGRDTDENGNPIYTASVSCNTHGSICEIKGQWYVFYHRQCGNDEYSRQAMVAPIKVSVQRGKGGKVTISEGEYNSEGFALGGLDPSKRWSAGIACWYRGPAGAKKSFPCYWFSGAHPQALRTGENHNPVINITAGSTVGYKYFNMDVMKGWKSPVLILDYVPDRIEGTVEVLADSPWESKGGKLLGSAQIKSYLAREQYQMAIPLEGVSSLSGKHSIFLRFSSDNHHRPICELDWLRFADGEKAAEPKPAQLNGIDPLFRDVHATDPATMVDGGKLWLFTGHDEESSKGTYKMLDWLVFSTEDLQNWTRYPVPLKLSDFKWAETGRAYAGQVIEHKGKYYWYVSTDGCGIGVAVSDKPEGPYHDAIGKPLLTVENCFASTHGWACIDPTVFIDDDGTPWLMWGNGQCYIVRLNDNMTEIDGKVHQVYMPEFTFEEAPWLHKYNGKYYLTYASGFPERIAYAVSDNIEGPYTQMGYLTGIAGNSSTTHPAIVEYKGQWYFFTHNGALPDGDGNHRSVTCQPLYYNPDGSMHL